MQYSTQLVPSRVLLASLVSLVLMARAAGSALTRAFLTHGGLL
jgi:hypothetical protein